MANKNIKNSTNILRSTTDDFLIKQKALALKTINSIRKKYKTKKGEKSSVEIIRELREKL